MRVEIALFLFRNRQLDVSCHVKPVKNDDAMSALRLGRRDTIANREECN